MMARQVRPWQVKPNSHREHKARQADQVPASLFHQGQRLMASIKKSGSMAAISTFLLSLLKAWQTGGDHLCVKTHCYFA